jgi:hypothetical protein
MQRYTLHTLQTPGIFSISKAQAEAMVEPPSAAERFAVLVGGVITPTGGVGIGASWMAARPVSVNAGLAVLLVNTGQERQESTRFPHRSRVAA